MDGGPSEGEPEEKDGEPKELGGGEEGKESERVEEARSGGRVGFLEPSKDQLDIVQEVFVMGAEGLGGAIGG